MQFKVTNVGKRELFLQPSKNENKHLSTGVQQRGVCETIHGESDILY